MTKVYISFNSLYLNVTVGKHSRAINFMDMSDGTGYLRTSDKVLQDALENSPYFGELYYLKEAVEDEKPKVVTASQASTVSPSKDETPVDLISAEEVKSVSDGRIFLKTNGIVEPFRSKEELLRIAAKNGYTFPNLN